MTASRTDPKRTSEIDPTRERLLEAAEKVFAGKGYAGATIRGLTSEARCNVASVNYYFRGKDKLYREMFMRRLTALRDERIAVIQQAVADAGEGLSLEFCLRTFTDAFMEPLVERSEGRQFMRLMTRELLDPHLPEGVVFNVMIRPVREAMVRLLMESLPGLSMETAGLCLHSLVGQLLHTLSARDLQASTNPRKAEVPRFAHTIEHIIHFSEGGMRAVTRRGNKQRKAPVKEPADDREPSL